MLFLSCSLLLSVSFSYEDAVKATSVYRWGRCKLHLFTGGAMQASPLHTTEMHASYTCLPAGRCKHPHPTQPRCSQATPVYRRGDASIPTPHNPTPAPTILRYVDALYL